MPPNRWQTGAALATICCFGIMGLWTATTTGCAASCSAQERRSEAVPIVATGRSTDGAAGGRRAPVTATPQATAIGGMGTKLATDDAAGATSLPTEGSSNDHDATANLDPSDDDVVGPPNVIEDCEGQLERSKVDFRPSTVPLVTQRNRLCGAHQAVLYVKGPEGIAFQPHPVVSCPLALGLARFEALVVRLALKHFNQRVKSVSVGGAYNCRPMARFKMMSEHSYANALDIYGVTLANGQRITVLRDFGRPDAAPNGSAGAFLRELARAAYDEDVFSVVVTRFFDALHRDHIHVDMAHYRTDGTR